MEDLNELVKLLNNIQGKFALLVHCVSMTTEAQEEFVLALKEYEEKRDTFLVARDLEDYLKQPPEAE